MYQENVFLYVAGIPPPLWEAADCRNVYLKHVQTYSNEQTIFEKSNDSRGWKNALHMQIFKNVPLKLKTKQTVLDLRNQTKLSFSKGLIVDCMELRQTKNLLIMQSRTSILLSNNFSQAFLVLGTTAGAYCGN